MSMIKVENLTFSYPSGSENIFEDVSFQFDTDWKLGFVGRNGRGKTTFLKLLQNQYEYQGKILSSVSFDFFPCPVTHKDRLTFEILEEIAPLAEEWEFRKEFSLLDIKEDVLWRPFHTLSSGEQTKTLLAALFLKEENFLLIDEPTNHLDIRARALVSSYLQKKKGFLLVSHDRAFLDGCVDHILSLNRTNMEIQSGNFSSWLTNFKRQQDFETAKTQKLKKEISHLQQAAKKTSDWSAQAEAGKYGNGPVDRGYIGHKSAKMMKRAKSIDARQTKALREKSNLLKNAETTEKLKLLPLSYHTDTLASFSEVSIVYDKTPICQPLSFSIQKKDRLALRGKNGSGKSSLLKLLTGAEIPHTGTLCAGSNLLISYVPQDTSFLKGSLSDFALQNHIEESLFKTILRKLDFERTQLQMDMQLLSEGQKKKVLIAKSLCEQAHLYVWDEPLNFIDIYSRMQIEELLLEFAPAMIFVEHDQTFCRKIATKTLDLQ